jgi:site-specific recombinase XerD
MRTMGEALTEYVAVRRALGAQLREPAVTLGHFVAFVDRQGAAFITIDLALRWAMSPVDVQRATWARRLSHVRRFATWLHAHDPRTQIPPARILTGRSRRRQPHIFTDQEITALMTAARRLASFNGLRAHTYTTLIGLLTTTGLRPGEALRLKRADVDLEHGMLFIRDSKFGKSRFVPLHESSRAALASYARRRRVREAQTQTDAFLVSDSERPLSGSAARRTFAHLTGAVGLRLTTGRRVGRGPRLQDLRHTFTTRTLVEWYRAGRDVTRALPILSTYLGHSDVAHTYWYIAGIPELLQLATDKLNGRRAGGGQ